MIYLFSHTPYEDKEVIHVQSVHVHFLSPKLPSLSNIDAVIFTSKNGVIGLDKLLQHSWRKLPSYVIGEGTSKEVKNLGANVKYTSKSSYGDEFAKEIAPLLKNKKVLFSRAQDVVSNVSEILRKNAVTVVEIISYKSTCTICEDFKKPQTNSILIFTSPSCAKCFLECFSWEHTWKCICIGKKTANVLPKNVSYLLPQSKSIDECVTLAKNLHI